MDGTVIVADDDRTIRTVLTQALIRAGCKVRATGSASTLWRWIEAGEGDAVVSDVMMPDGNGLELLPQIRRKRPNLPVIIISAQNTVITAIKASEYEAYDYLPKPFDLKTLLSKVSRALTQSNTSDVNTFSDTVERQHLPLIGSSPAMQEVYRIVARVLNTDLNVMITGESGTGKNLLVEILHQHGQAATQSLIVLNVPTMTPQNLEEIFLDENSMPHNATVYLDEISDMSAEAQLVLLNLMQSPDVQAKALRFMSSTQKSLSDLVRGGLFREDLFYRLNVIPIHLPPLRDRVDDISKLTYHFLQKAAVKGMPHKMISAKALEQIRIAAWPGNVRELENFVQQAVVLCAEEEIDEAHVQNVLKQAPKPTSGHFAKSGAKLSSLVEQHLKHYFNVHGDDLPPPGLYNRILRELELPLIALTLSATRGNQIKAAQLLGLNRNTLRKKINDLDIQVTRSKKMM